MNKAITPVLLLSWSVLICSLYLSPAFILAFEENARIINVSSNKMKYNLGETINFKMTIHNTGHVYLNNLTLNLDISGPNNRNIRQGQIISGINLNISELKVLNWSWHIQRNAVPGVYYVTVGLWNEDQTRSFDIKYGIVTFEVESEFILLYTLVNSFSTMAWLVLLTTSFSGAVLAYQVCKKKEKSRSFNLFLYAAFLWIATAVFQLLYWILASASLVLALFCTVCATIFLRYEISYSELKLLVKKLRKKFQL